MPGPYPWRDILWFDSRKRPLNISIWRGRLRNCAQGSTFYRNIIEEGCRSQCSEWWISGQITFWGNDTHYSVLEIAIAHNGASCQLNAFVTSFTMVRNRCFSSHIGHRDVKNFPNGMKLGRIVAWEILHFLVAVWQSWWTLWRHK